MFNKELLYRHNILRQLYDRINETVEREKIIESCMSIDELHNKTGISKDKLKKQLHYLTTQDITKVYGKNKGLREVKWLLLKSEYYLDEHYLNERKVKNFEKYKRTFTYLGLPLGLILTVLSLWSKIQSNSNTDRIEKLEEMILSDTTEVMHRELSELVFYHLDSIEFNQLIKNGESEGLYETGSDFGFYSSRVIEHYNNRNITVEVLNNKMMKERFSEKDLEHPYGFAVKSVEGETKIFKGIYTDSEIIEIIEEFKSKKDE
jgi:hypothetical protein